MPKNAIDKPARMIILLMNKSPAAKNFLPTYFVNIKAACDEATTVRNSGPAQGYGMSIKEIYAYNSQLTLLAPNQRYLTGIVEKCLNLLIAG